MDSLVSIIVPIYGVADVLDECIESIVEQTYKNLEIILVDDGAIDGSSSICDRWADRDTRIITIHQENRGVSAARNAGIDAAHGKYISFIDGDDIVSSDYIKTMIEALTEDNDNDFVMCNYYSFDCSHKKNNVFPVSSGRYDADILFQPIFFGFFKGKKCSMSTALFLGLFLRDKIEKNNIRFDTKLRKSEDWLFYSEYYPLCKNISVIDLPLYGYRQFPESVTHAYSVPTDSGTEKSLYILRKFETNMKTAEIEEKLWKHYLQMRYNQMIKRYAIGVWDSRNMMTLKDKFKMVNVYVDNMKKTVNIGGYYAKDFVAQSLVLEYIRVCIFVSQENKRQI